MLILSRRAGERLMIDGNIEVTVVEIRPDRIKLGIVAPPEVSVHREEVYRRIVELERRSDGVEPNATPIGTRSAAIPPAAFLMRSEPPVVPCGR